MIAQCQVNWGIGPRQDVGAGTQRSAADRRCQRLEQFPPPRPPAWAGATMAVAAGFTLLAATLVGRSDHQRRLQRPVRGRLDGCRRDGTGLAVVAWSFAALGELTQ